MISKPRTVEGKKVKSDEKADTNNNIKKKERINWPKGNSPEWKKLDEDMSALLRTLISSAEVRAKNYPNVI